MTEVVSVRFKSRGKVYFFDPNGVTVATGEPVIVETSKGLELGECARGNHEVDDERIIPPLRPVVRVATAADLKVAETNKAREKDAFRICQKKIAEHGLSMKLVDVECNFEGNKILFFFTSDGRVDFRDLVKDLASVFRTRIELRQIGVRDEAKMLGGLGICGRPFCCSQFLDDFQPVSTKMAKTQSMSLNPAKISGSCGRLMCCLRYEQEAYEELVKKVPKNGTFVETPAGYGSVSQVQLLRQKVKVRLDGEGDQVIKQYDADEIAVVPGGRPKAGETPPSVLQVKVKPVQHEEEPEDEWAMPEVIFHSAVEEELAGEQHEETAEEAASAAPRKRNNRRRHRKKPSGAKPQGENAKPQKEGEKTEGGKKPQGEHQNQHQHHHRSSRSSKGGKGGGQQPKAEHTAAQQQIRSTGEKTGEKSGEHRGNRGGRRRYGRSKPRNNGGGEGGQKKE